MMIITTTVFDYRHFAASERWALECEYIISPYLPSFLSLSKTHFLSYQKAYVVKMMSAGSPFLPKA